MDYSNDVALLRKIFNNGRTKNINFRIQQLEGLMQMYRENEAVFVDALEKDLRKPKWESVGMEIEFCINDALGCLQKVRENAPHKHPKHVKYIAEQPNHLKCLLFAYKVLW